MEPIAFLAEHVLTVSALQKFVDAHPSAPQTVAEDGKMKLRYRLALGLVREAKSQPAQERARAFSPRPGWPDTTAWN